MNTKTQKALKMAIEAMERAEEIDWELNSLHVLNILQAIQACKEALAQPAQEPDLVWQDGKFKRRKDLTLYGGEKFYTHPAPSCKCEECGMKYCECGERK